jgi:uncharacterized protein YeaO (DUF488 family)
MTIRIKRVYAPPDPGDGTRVLVDRLWPRGFAKASAPWDHWMKALAPSDGLRKRVHAMADGGKADEGWAMFVAAYAEELDDQPDAVAELQAMASDGTVTLLYAARDEDRNNAVALAAYMMRIGDRQI